MRRSLVIAAIGLLGAQTLAAQVSAGRLVEQARAQLEAPNPDSAIVLLEAALQPARGATKMEQTRAFVLYGLAHLLLDNVQAARSAFRQALQRDATLRVDSLSFFTDALAREFNAERAAIDLVAPPPLAVSVVMPTDTTLPASGGSLRIVARASRRARVVAVVTAADASPEARTTAIWADTAGAGAEGMRAWNLRDRNGDLVSEGRYTLRVFATDSAGQDSPVLERMLVIARAAVDTQPHAPPLTPEAFAPESLRLRRASPSVLLVGVLLGATAAVVPSAVASTELNAGRATDRTAVAVAGVIAVTGVVGFLAGHRIRPLPENVDRNEQLRARDAEQRRAIVEANRAARARAAVRIVVEGQ